MSWHHKLQVKALIDVILEVDTSLEQEVSRNWAEIMKHFYVFDRRHKEVREMSVT